MWVARSLCAPTGETTLRAQMASSGWWTVPTVSACRTVSVSCRACWWRSAWLEQPSSSSQTSRTYLEHCPLTLFRRPWTWAPSAAITGASRAAVLSPGRICCLASTGSLMTFPVVCLLLTELLQCPQLTVQAPTPHQTPAGGDRHQPARLTLPTPPQPAAATAAHCCSPRPREGCHPGSQSGLQLPCQKERLDWEGLPAATKVLDVASVQQ